MVIVIGSVDAAVSVGLQMGATVGCFFDFDGGDFLSLVVRQVDCEGESFDVSAAVLGYLDVVDCAVFVEVEVVEPYARGVEQAFEFFAGFRFFNELTDRLQVEATGGIRTRNLLYRNVVGVAVT